MTEKMRVTKTQVTTKNVTDNNYHVVAYILPLSLSLSLSAESPPVKKRKVCKNPAVDTSFLPDRKREVSLSHVTSCDPVSSRELIGLSLFRGWL